MIRYFIFACLFFVGLEFYISGFYDKFDGIIGGIMLGVWYFAMFGRSEEVKR